MTFTERPRVTLHFAQSLDGRIALAQMRTPLSSRAGITLAHQARADHDAVLVGRATVKIDDPRLAVVGSDTRQPRRIVLASTLDVPLTARVLQGGPGTLIIGVEGRASMEARAGLAGAGAQVRLVPAGDEGLVSLPHALVVIRAWGVQRLLVEGGAHVLSSFLRHRLADEATIEIVPRLLGAHGVAALGEIGVAALEHAVALEDASVERADASIVVRGRLVY
jgi:riboflavin-specific deaminase-like protein